MSLRILFKPEQISRWIAERRGTPVRHGDDFRIAFEPTGDETLTVEELLDEMKFRHMVMLVDEQPGKTFHKIYAHS
jgi:hypothetical protein